ncbi:MAG: hypothetical protein ACTSYI_08740 [Promethearchaeota archaeon]
MALDLWTELVQNFKVGLEKSLELIKERDVENIPGARDQLVRRFEELIRYLPRNEGDLLVKAVDESIQNAFFPRTNVLSEAFSKILTSLEQEPDNAYIINELINGFIASKTKSFGSFKEGPIIDRIIEGFKKSKRFRITDYSFYAMFGDPNNPRKTLQAQLEKIADFIGLVVEERVIEHDLARSERKIIKYYTFPPEILEILEGSYLISTEKGEVIISENFDKNVFTSLFLAHYSIQRSTLGKYKINGICNIFALILILSFMPKVSLSEDNPILRDPGFDGDRMSVIPKSWMRKDILAELIQPTIELVAFRIGASKWQEKIEKSDAKKRLHLQSNMLIRDVNKWVLGNLCRVEIPIFVEISNIFQEITVAGTSDLLD